ncbi:hypothetical protein [Streptomyces albofaciens]|uniref:hypothetical protein n=1 Tax=Streptomyces albofaciens TaxID=66866 RepID=UPI001238B897|nr:hypothetical protein [Streptomyces albofaciens]
MAGAAPSAQAFGTVGNVWVPTKGWTHQNYEHEFITRAALGCHAGPTGDPVDPTDCFEDSLGTPTSETSSLEQITGRNPSPYDPESNWGGVGLPDQWPATEPAPAHCDNADYLAEIAGNHTRAVATDELLKCVNHARALFREAVEEAKPIVDDNGNLAADRVLIPAKRNVLRTFGRMLHTLQDFYAHSNWSDIPKPTEPISPFNPPGLDQRTPSLLFNNGYDRHAPGASDVPEPLSTGCYDENQPNSTCRQPVRVSHGDPFDDGATGSLNKDKGKIDPTTGRTSDPRTDRGKIHNNFAQAVRNAVTETRLQWQDLKHALNFTYGVNRGPKYACALMSDEPSGGGHCNAPSPAQQPPANGPCDTATWSQPGGTGHTIYMSYRNCTDRPVFVAPYGEGTNDNRYSYVRQCRNVPGGGGTTRWVIDAGYFPPEWPGIGNNTQKVVHCFKPWGGPSPAAARAASSAEKGTAAEPPCGDSFAQPGGTGTPVTIYHRNCLAQNVEVAPLATTGADRRYAYSSQCRYLETGRWTSWTIGPGYPDTPFPPENVNLQKTTRCL